MIEIATPPGVTLTPVSSTGQALSPSPIKGEGYKDGLYNGGWLAMTDRKRRKQCLIN
jgi:hypothetical protein